MKPVFKAIALIFASALLDGSAAMAADVAQGEQLARRWCAACHVVAADQRQAASDAPPFATIAAKPDFSVGRLVFFLLDPHPKMPNMGLSRGEAGDLAAYIGSLAK
jgi:mono/diheme cytochrome c family protein